MFKSKLVPVAHKIIIIRKNYRTLMPWYQTINNKNKERSRGIFGKLHF